MRYIRTARRRRRNIRTWASSWLSPVGQRRGRLYQIAREEPRRGHRQCPHHRSLLSRRAAVPRLRHSRRRPARPAYSVHDRRERQPDARYRSHPVRRRCAGRTCLLSRRSFELDSAIVRRAQANWVASVDLLSRRRRRCSASRNRPLHDHALSRHSPIRLTGKTTSTADPDLQLFDGNGHPGIIVATCQIPTRPTAGAVTTCAVRLCHDARRRLYRYVRQHRVCPIRPQPFLERFGGNSPKPRLS